jgi:hypothetical protein
VYTGQTGTFGNGRFRGRVPNFRTVVRNGAGSARGSRTVCRVPSQLSASVSLTFAVAT